MLGGYAGYVLSAYAVVLVCVAGLAGKAVLDARRLKRRLRDLDASTGRAP